MLPQLNEVGTYLQSRNIHVMLCQPFQFCAPSYIRVWELDRKRGGLGVGGVGVKGREMVLNWKVTPTHSLKGKRNAILVNITNMSRYYFYVACKHIPYDRVLGRHFLVHVHLLDFLIRAQRKKT